LEEYGFLVDIVGKQLVRKDGFKVSCRKRKIPQIIVMEENMEEGYTVLLVDAASHYPDYAQVFSAEQANRLPPHQKWDHEISLKDPQTKVSNGPIYKTTWEEDEAVRAYLAEHTQSGKVRKSRSAAGAPILFVRKKDGSLRLCVDY